MAVNLDNYREAKPDRLRRVIWFFVNIFVYPLLSNKNRSRILRLFGAKVGRRCRLYRSARYYAPWNLILGDFVCVGPRTDIYNKAKITIGSQVVISQDSYICTASHDVHSASMKLVLGPINIGSQSWIAAHCIVLPGVTIGEGAVIGAGAVVARSIPDWSVAVGNPANVVRKRELN